MPRRMTRQMKVRLGVVLPLAISILLAGPSCTKSKQPATGSAAGGEESSPASPDPKKQQFLAELTSVLHEISPGETFTYDEDEFAIRFNGGSPLNLGNVFAAWREARGSRRKEILVNVVKSPRNADRVVPQTFAEVERHLLVKVRNAVSWELMGLAAEAQGAQGMPAPVEMAVGQHLKAAVVYDGDAFMADIHADHLADWHVPASKVLAIALSNLATYLDKPFEAVGPGVYVAAGRDDYEASRMLIDGAVQELVLKGRPLAFPVNRGFLVITGDEDQDGLESAVKLVEAQFERSYPVSVVPVLYDGGRWKTHRLPLDTGLGRRLEKLRVREEANIYRDQATLLRRLAEPRADAAFVADYMVIEDMAGDAIESLCTWGEGVPTLLPVTDRIAFMSDKGPASKPTSRGKVARFEDALRVVGHRMKRVNMVPVRYRVESFPTAAEFKAMGAREFQVPAP